MIKESPIVTETRKVRCLISKEFDDDFRRVAFEKKLKNVELLELALECYKKHEL